MGPNLERNRWLLAGGFLVATLSCVQAQTNAWLSSGSGKWEDATNWSQGIPGPGDSVFITNAGTKTVLFDATTISAFSNDVPVTNLTVSAPSNSVNTLSLSNAGTNFALKVHETFTLLSSGVLSVSNSLFTVDCARPPVGNTDNSSLVQLDGLATLNKAVFNASNAFQVIVGATANGTGAGTLNATNSTFKAYKLFVGDFSDGTANFINSTSRLGYYLIVGEVYQHTGTVTLAGGQFLATNTPFGPGTTTLYVGNRGTGQLTISNADVQTAGVAIGAIRGSSGTLSMKAGTLRMAGNMVLGNDVEPNGPPYATGALQVSGGQIWGPELHIGYQATGTVSVVSGLLSNGVVTVGESTNGFGSLTVSGGTELISGSLTVGNTNAVASVSVNGGSMLVTNFTGTANVILNGSALVHSGGRFKADNLVLTNGGSLVTISNLIVAPLAGVTNMLTLTDSSTITISNAVFGLGNNPGGVTAAGNGVATVSNATLTAQTLNLGSSLGGTGNLLIQSNGFVNITSNINLASGSLLSTSLVSVIGGTLSVSNGLLAVGSAGSGQMSVSSGGRLVGQTIKLGGPPGTASGDLFLQSGGHLVFHTLSCNQLAVPGGDADGTGGTIIIGDDHPALMSVSGGTVTNVGSLIVGSHFDGTFTQSGGITVVHTNLFVGDCDAGVVGYPSVSGGTLYVTNASHTAVLVISNGTFVLNPGGQMVVDKLVLTNSCAHFFNNAGPGALQVMQTNLGPGLSAAGDGIPNAWKQQYGLDPFSSSVAGADPDGDGMSNYAEYVAGTDPLNASSNFRIVHVARTNSIDLRIDWTAVGGHSYVVQAITNSASFSTTNFYDLPGATVPFITPGEGTTNYVHPGGATNQGGYYRVRVVGP
jgi:hypothetical protein